MLWAPNADVYGVTETTCLRVFALLTRSSTRAATAGSVSLAPSEEATTIFSVSPEFFGDADWSSDTASDDWVWGRVKEFVYADPTVLPNREAPTRTRIQMASTIHRCRTHQ